MSNVSRLFPTLEGFEVRNERGGWVIYLIYSDAEAVEWLYYGESGKVYASLGDAIDFFETAGISQFTVSLVANCALKIVPEKQGDISNVKI